MTHKEKAKAYDKALKRAKEIKSKILSSHLSTESRKAVSEYIDTIIPELRESEDERIRKWLYDYISNCPNNNFAFYGGVGKDAVLNYLEKQKEQPTNEEMLRTLRVEYEKGVADTIAKYEQKEQKPIAESERLANEVIEYLIKCGYSPVLKDDLKKEHFHIDIPRHEDDFWHSEEYKHCRSVLGKYYMEGDYGGDTYTLYVWRETEDQKPSEWSEEDEKMLSDVIKLLKVKNEKFIPCDAEVSWLNELPNRFNLQPKQEWSEKDEYEMSRRCGQALFDHGYIKEYEWFKTYLQSKTELDEKDEKTREGLLKIFKQSQSGHWGGMAIKDIVAFLERQENNIDKLRKISTKAEEDWLKIQKQWEKVWVDKEEYEARKNGRVAKEDKYKSWMADYFRQETIDGFDWETSIIESKKEGKLLSLWNSMLMGRLGMYVRNWMREQHPEIDQDFPNYADFEDYSWKIFQDLVNEWEVTPTERNVEDVAAEYIEGVKSLHKEPDWNLMHTAVIYGYQLGTEKCKTK